MRCKSRWTARIAVTPLEDRITPAVNSWLGGNGDWTDTPAVNWSLHHVPAPDEDVSISNGATVTHNTDVAAGGDSVHDLSLSGSCVLVIASGTTLGAADVAIAGATLTAEGTVNVSGTWSQGAGNDFGTLNGAGDVTITGQLTWNSGVMSGSGATFANGGMTLAVLTGSDILDGRRLDSAGLAVATKVFPGDIVLRNGAIFNNNGTFDLQGNTDILDEGGAASVFRNNGFFEKTVSGLSKIDVPFNNAGTVDVDVATLSFDGGGTSTGPWVVELNAVIEFHGGAFDLNAGSAFTGDGSARFNAGVVNLNDTYSVGSTDVPGGTVNFNADASTTALNLGIGAAPGTVGGSGNLVVSNLLSWSSGTMTGSGITTIENELDLVSQGPMTLDGRRLDSDGLAFWVNAGNWTLSNGAVFNNGGTFNTQNDLSLVDGGGATSQFNNNGAVNVEAGTLSFGVELSNYSGGKLTGGTYMVAGILEINDADITTNAATIVLDGPTSKIVDQTSADALSNFTTNAASGSFTVTNGRTTTTLGAFTNAGTLVINASSFTAGGTFTQTGGSTSITANGQLKSNAGTLDFQDGSLFGQGTVVGNLTNAASISPGDTSPGILSIVGNFTQPAAGTLNIRIGGTTPGVLSDLLLVSGVATLGGTLAVSEINGFHPAVGDSYEVVTFSSKVADFDSMAGFVLGNAVVFEEEFDPTAGATALDLVVHAAHFHFQTPPIDTLAGQTFPVVVEIVDELGHLLPFDDTDQVTLQLNRHTFADGVTLETQPAVNGVASFSLTIDFAAINYVLSAAGSGFSPIFSNSFTIQQPADFTSAAGTAFVVGAQKTFIVSAPGVPAPVLTQSNGDALPSGLSFFDMGDGTAQLRGTSGIGTGGTYTLHFSAHNGVGTDANQTFALTVNEAPAITSAASATFIRGTNGSFPVAASGFPSSTFSETGVLPNGVTLSPSGLLSGMPTQSGVFPIVLSATNGIGTAATQSFTLTVQSAPTIISADHVTFQTGSNNSFQVTATGFPTPTFHASGMLPPGIALSTAGLLHGATTQTGDFPFTITATNGIGTDATQSFSLIVGTAPSITSVNTANFTLLKSGSFQMRASGFPNSTFSETGPLPPGMTLSVEGLLSGIPAAGSAGAFPIVVTAHNGVGSDATQDFVVTVGSRLVIGGLPDGTSQVFYPANGGNFNPTAVADLNAFGGLEDDIRPAAGDVNGDGVTDNILVTGPGTPIRMAVVSGTDNRTLLVAPFDPFGGDFTGGGFVAVGDFDSDGRAEFIVTPDQGGGPRISIFSLNQDGTLTTRANFFGIDDPNFRGGARPAAGDINGDGTPDLIVAAGFGGGPRTAIFDGKSLFTTPQRLVGDFFAFPGTDAVNLRNGVFVAAGDVNGDGKADLVFGGGPGGGPRIFILSGASVAAGDVTGAQASPIANYFVAGNVEDRGGVRLAVKDADGDGKADVIAGSGQDSPARARIYLGKNIGGGEPSQFQDLNPFGGPTLDDGIYVG